MKRLEEIKDWKEMINEVVCGDCLEGMKLISDKSIDLVLTDPPYEITGGGGKASFINTGKFDRGEMNAISKGFGVETVFTEFKRVLKVFNLFLFCSNNQVPKIMEWGIRNNFYTTLLIWHKTNSAPFSNNVWRQDVEFIIHIREKGSIFTGNAELKKKVWSQGYEVSKHGHPTEKPTELIKKYISIGSEEGAVVLDPFMGSWTTARACKDLGRNFIGFELSEKYCQIGEKRLQQEILF